MEDRSVILVILDGYGIGSDNEGNAVTAARKPNIDSLFARYPHAVIRTSGMDVGLPDGQMGNSEVGHTNIGAGRIVYQELTRISKSIIDGDFFEKTEFNAAIDNCTKNGSKLHLFGLLSDGGVHSHNTHLYALLEIAKKRGLRDVFVHCFFDGRDVPPDSALGYVRELEGKLVEIGTGRIATVMGRYYAMDRDKRWERVKVAYDAMTLGTGVEAASAVEAVERSYSMNEFDEFVKPAVIVECGKPVATIDAGDSVIFFNFRPDRAREITRAFVDKGFDGFERAKGCLPLFYVCMTQYDASIGNVHVAFKPEILANTFADCISRLGRRQLRIAETEKYAHVTFFFNGGIEKVYDGEDRVLIPSSKVATYDMKPEMSAFEVTDEAVRRIGLNEYDVIILNYANADMVGHTGVFNAAKAAIEAVDACIGRIYKAVSEQNGIMIVTADHGNAEQMTDPETGGPFTAHTTNPVPLIVTGIEGISLRDGRLADLAPTMLDIMGIEKPAEMTGSTLIER